MTMKELCSKFLSLLRYVLYIIDEKPKIQWFLSCFPIMFKEQIEYDYPEMLEEAMRKENLCYDQNKNKTESIPAWKNQRKNKYRSYEEIFGEFKKIKPLMFNGETEKG